MQNYYRYAKVLQIFTKKISMITGNTFVKGHENNGKLEATLMSKETLSRRTLDRFRRSNPSKHLRWIATTKTIQGWPAQCFF